MDDSYDFPGQPTVHYVSEYDQLQLVREKRRLAVEKTKQLEKLRDCLELRAKLSEEKTAQLALALALSRKRRLIQRERKRARKAKFELAEAQKKAAIERQQYADLLNHAMENANTEHERRVWSELTQLLDPEMRDSLCCTRCGGKIADVSSRGYVCPACGHRPYEE